MADHEGTSVQIPDIQAADDAPDPTDPGGWGAKFTAALNLQIGNLTDAQSATTAEIRKLRQQARRAPATVKISSVFTWSSAAGAQMCQQGASGAGVQIGGPEIGQQWNVRQITVGGTTLAGAPAGVAWFFEAPAPPNEQSITSAVDWTHTSLPTVSFYAPGQFYVPPNSNLWMVVTGGTNGTQYVASLTIEVTPFVPMQAVVES